MKLISLALTIATITTAFLGSSSQVAAKNQPAKQPLKALNDDFLVGFETGIFLRKNPEQIEEYNCP